MHNANAMGWRSNKEQNDMPCRIILNRMYKGWNFNSGNYLFTTDKK